jgi:hypothetical protein
VEGGHRRNRGRARPGQIEGWIGAASIDLTSDDLDNIAIATEWSGAGAGPAHPASVHSASHPGRAVGGSNAPACRDRRVPAVVAAVPARAGDAQTLNPYANYGVGKHYGV